MLKTAAIIGYGKSGRGAAKILEAQGYAILVYDDNVEGCRKLSEYKDGVDLTIISPGIMLSSLPVKPSNFTSEIDLAYGWRPEAEELSKVLTVTGTNGKSTVAYLTTRILNNAGVRAVACGNIGYSFADAVLDEKEGTVFVVELSSFQIELLKDYRTSGVVITNITPDHLDRYGNMEAYAAAKMKIFSMMEDECVVVSEPNTDIVNRVMKAYAKARYIDNTFNAWPKLVSANRLDLGGYYIDPTKCKLFGRHNLINLVYALALASAAIKLEGDVTHLIEDINGMPHRTEIVHEDDHSIWINDSKATNIDSTIVALKSCSQDTILFLGGRDKKGEYQKLSSEIERVVKKVYLFGEAADTIEAQLKQLSVPIVKVGKLQEAVHAAYLDILDADSFTVVLLSPSCSSFDEFRDFEHRGEEFRNYVLAIYDGKGICLI